jgi:GTP-binding protein
VEPDGPLRLQISALDYSSFVGAIAIGRISRGVLRRNQPVAVVARDGSVAQARINQVFGFRGLERVEVPQAEAGDIVAFSGIERPCISDTLCDPSRPDPMPPLTVDEPTISMTFEANTSPFAGREGAFVTSRQLAERLEREAIHNVALRVEPTEEPEKFRVSGRGELHLAVLIETMRREGYELAVSRPRVILKEIDGVVQEPFERLLADIDTDHQGAVMEALGARGARLQDMRPEGTDRVRLDYVIPSRGLIGFQSEFRSLTSGSGILHHMFDHYGPSQGRGPQQRQNGVLVANGQGKALGYALFNLQERGRLMIGPGDEIYEGQIVGIHARSGDLTVNPMKGKQLTNVRAAGKDDNVLLTPAQRLTLEQGMTFLGDDELMEVTPAAIRFRKRHLRDADRRRQSRQALG